MTGWLWDMPDPVSGESAAGEERQLDLGERVDLLAAPLLLAGDLRQREEPRRRDVVVRSAAGWAGRW